MKAGEKLTSEGKEVALFPLEYLYLTQEEGGDYSHVGTLAMDFSGWGASGKVYNCPYYAPVSMKCVASTESANRIWESLDVVICPGFTDYLTMVVAHDNNPPAVGTVVYQGDVLGHTGTAGNVSGDHVHINTARGKYAGWQQVPPNQNWQLRNSTHVYDSFYTNDTVIVHPLSYNWRNFDGGVTPPTPLSRHRKRFPWVLYARKLRRKN